MDGFLGTEAGLSSDLNLLAYIILIMPVMLAGFVFILFGISKAFPAAPVLESASDIQAKSLPMDPAIIGTIAGIITEFLGGTFLFLYKATVQQAGSYTGTLERMNSVGMAMQILDTISESSRELKDSTKAEMVKMLLSQSRSTPQGGTTQNGSIA